MGKGLPNTNIQVEVITKPWSVIKRNVVSTSFYQYLLRVTKRVCRLVTEKALYFMSRAIFVP